MASEAEEAEAAFRAHDFDGDDDFRAYKSKVDLVHQGSAQEVEMKLRRRYFRKSHNVKLSREAPQAVPASASGDRPPSGAERSPPARSSSGASAAPSTGTVPSGKFEKFVKIIDKSHLQVVLHVGTVLLCISALAMPILELFVLPSRRPSEQQTMVARALLVASVSFALSLIKQIGIPQMNRHYLERVTMHTDFHYLFYCLTFHGSSDVTICLLPILMFSMFNSITNLKSFCERYNPRLLEAYGIGRRIDDILNFREDLLFLTASFECGLLFYLLLGVFQRKVRGIFLIFSYVNFLRLRYNVSSHSKLFWATMETRASVAITSYLPMALPYYSKACSLIRNFAKLG